MVCKLENSSTLTMFNQLCTANRDGADKIKEGHNLFRVMFEEYSTIDEEPLVQTRYIKKSTAVSHIQEI